MATQAVLCIGCATACDPVLIEDDGLCNTCADGAREACAEPQDDAIIPCHWCGCTEPPFPPYPGEWPACPRCNGV